MSRKQLVCKNKLRRTKLKMQRKLWNKWRMKNKREVRNPKKVKRRRKRHQAHLRKRKEKNIYLQRKENCWIKCFKNRMIRLQNMSQKLKNMKKR